MNPPAQLPHPGRDSVRFGLPDQIDEPAQAGPGSLSISELSRTLWKYRLAILATAILGLIAGLALALFAVPKYRSAAVIEVSSEGVELVEVGARQAIPVSDTQALETSIGLLKSASLAERVARELRLVPTGPAAGASDVQEAVQALTEGLTVERVGDSRLIRISYVSPDRNLAARVPNVVAAQFIQSVLERRFEANDYARDYLQKRIAEVRGRLEDSERRLVAYAQQQNIVSVGGDKTAEGGGGGQSLDAASLAAANAELTIAQNARVAAEQRFRQSVGGAPTNEVLQSSTLQAYKTNLAQLQAEYQRRRAALQPDHPELVELQANIAAVRNNIARETGTVTATLGAEYRAAQARENELRGRVDRLRRAVLNLQGRSIQYAILQRDADTNRQLYDALLQRYKEVGVSGGVGANQIALVDKAQPPQAPFEPNPVRSALLGALLGLVLGVVGALAYALLANRVSTLEDLVTRLGLPALGVVPRMTSSGPLEDALLHPHSPLSESYASLRSSLQFIVGKPDIGVLLVTGSGPGEGKTTTALALAHSFARLGRSTLLIDADLRNPSLFANSSSSLGLSDVIVGHASLAEATEKLDVEHLHALQAGSRSITPADLLASAGLQSVIDQARQAYDVVVIDSPPTLGLADTPLLSALSDHTLLVLEANKVRFPVARLAVSRLRQAGANLVGGVLTKVDLRETAYGYGYGYGAEAGEDRQLSSGQFNPGEATVATGRAQSRWSRLALKALFWIGALVGLLLALVPTPPALLAGIPDKAQHFIGFSTLALLATLAYPRVALPVIGLGLSAFGLVIEILQSLPGIDRDADLMDGVVNALGIVSILILVHLFRLSRRAGAQGTRE